jgi:hypothetical protein
MNPEDDLGQWGGRVVPPEVGINDVRESMTAMTGTGDPDPGWSELITGMLETISSSPLYVNVDWLQLLEHFDGDEAKALDMLGKLKDLLA